MTVKYVPTDDNTADLFTKVLTRQPFEKHRRRVMNLTDKKSRPVPQDGTRCRGGSGTRSDKTHF